MILVARQYGLGQWQELRLLELGVSVAFLDQLFDGHRAEFGVIPLGDLRELRLDACPA